MSAVFTFRHKEAVPGGRRLRLGIAGPSRSGKTYSALLVGTGISKALGQPLFLIDCDNEFALDYAGEFVFQHVDFQPPFTSERYQEAIEYCIAQGAGVIIVDHMTHEHTGPGGVLERQQEEEKRIAEKWKVSREKATRASWNTAKAIPHGRFVNFVTRVKQPIIFNFRAKDKLKEVKSGGKTEWVHTGYLPLCTEQFDYEMTAMLILPPNSDGTPDKALSEIRKPLRDIVKLGEPITESLGARLAAWAAGGKESATGASTLTTEGSVGSTAEPSGARPAADPMTDDSIAEEVATRVKEGNYALALDLLRGMKDAARRETAEKRVRAKMGG